MKLVEPGFEPATYKKRCHCQFV